MSDAKMIRVWRFYDAPAELRELSPHGGDEDWLAHVPRQLVDTHIPWMTEGMGGFGVCEVSEHFLPDGSLVRIGAHS
jgi:hypothetical protein